jgi:hypothetical protein
MPLISQKRIGQDDELAHDRRQGDFGRLSRPEQRLVLGFQIRIEAGCHQRRHGQRLAHMGATTADRAAATRGSTIAGHRSQAGEAGHLALFESSKVRHVDEQTQGRDLGNTGNAHEDRQTGGEILDPHRSASERPVPSHRQRARDPLAVSSSCSIRTGKP